MKVLLIYLALTSVFSIAHACSCTPLKPLEQEFQRFSVVFLGTIGGNRPTVFEAKVEKAYKGVAAGDMVSIVFDPQLMCGYEWQRGTKYLVFADEAPSIDGYKTKAVSVTICSPTKPAAQAKAELRRLAKLAKRG